ncbi:ABC transporter substrate-binding protein [Marinomonas epiphytica]
MLRWLLVLVLGCCNALYANPVYFGHPEAPRTLVVHSPVDLESFSPILQAFVALHPEIRLVYRDLNSSDLYRQTIIEHENPTASLVMSSAMDLQLKLVNDGLAQTYRSERTDSLPATEKWRNQVFAFSYDPIVMVVNKRLYPGEPPSDRQSLLTTIRQNEELFTSKIGTYDIRTSGVGYLLVSQDARQADATWGRLLEAFGSHDVQTYCCSRDMMDDVADGKLMVGYNLLASYVSQRARIDDNLVMVLPTDYTLMLKRVALIPKYAPNAQDAGLLIDFLLSDIAQQMMVSMGLMYPIKSDLRELDSPYFAQALGPTRSIELDQQLLVGRDSAKQKRLIQSWESAIENDHVKP